MEGYQAVGQTQLITSWAKEADMEVEECLPDMEEGEDKEPIQHKDPLTINQVLILKSESEKKRNNKCCGVCGKTFLYPKDLKKHELVHEKSFPFSCKVCSKGVRTISNMYKHLRVKHSLSEDLKSHILDANGEKYVDPKEAISRELEAGSIPTSFMDPDHVIAQGSQGTNKNGVALYRCLVCDKQITKYALKNHLNIHHGEQKFKCDLCPKSYFTNSALTNHKATSHQNVKATSFKCTNCFRSFRTVKVRDHHVESCQMDPQKGQTAFECRLCNKIFGYKNNLVSHQKSVHGLEGKKILDYNCKYCHEVLKGKLKLSKHIITAHPDATGELCDLCGKSFKTEIKLLRHISIHKSRERNLHRSFCPKKFFRKDILSVHEKVHTIPIICKECGKKFPEERYLENHILQHLEKKFECMYCTKCFASQELLEKHYEMHNETLSYTCNFCMKGFRNKLELKKHKTEHSDNFPLKCHICQKGFLQDSQLEKHVDLVHSKATELLIL